MPNRDAFFGVLKEILHTALISLGIFFFVYILIVQPHRVKGESMVPNFADGELLLTEKVTYRFQEVRRGDVIVFEAPTARKVDFIKRIIGLPGDSVEIQNGQVLVNNQRFLEPYETQSTDGSIKITLSQNQYFVLGDNRAASSDSRSFGPIDKGAIKGRAWLVYWPIFGNNNFEGWRIISRVNYTVSNSL